MLTEYPYFQEIVLKFLKFVQGSSGTFLVVLQDNLSTVSPGIFSNFFLENFSGFPLSSSRIFSQWCSNFLLEFCKYYSHSLFQDVPVYLRIPKPLLSFLPQIYGVCLARFQKYFFRYFYGNFLQRILQVTQEVFRVKLLKKRCKSSRNSYSRKPQKNTQQQGFR